MPERIQELIEVISRVDGAVPGSGLKKHRKMASSPFMMLRGTSSVFYHDLANLTFRLPSTMEAWPLTMVMGDCHVSNFGFFSEEGSHGDQIIFAPNDFDDACVGHAGWDLLRYGVSLLLCADHCQGGISGRYQLLEPIDKSKVIATEEATQALTAFWQAYRDTCKNLVEQSVDYRHVLQDFDESHVLYKLEQKASKRQAGGEDFLSKSSLAKAVNLDSGKPLVFLDIPEKFKAVDRVTYRTIEKVFAPYVDDQILDIVERVGAGTGSVNMQRYYLLIGPEQVSQEDLALCHIVEIKKQRAAAPLFEYEDLSLINLLSPAHLTVNCQRRMQRNPDLVLDDVLWKKAHWLVRSRHHARVSIGPEDIACGKRALDGGFQDYASACGEVLALAHARFDRRSKRFEKAVLATADETWQALESLQQEYAAQVIADWQWLSELEIPMAQ